MIVLQKALCAAISSFVEACTENHNRCVVYTARKHYLEGKCGWAPAVTLLKGQQSFNMAFFMDGSEEARFGHFDDEEHASQRMALARAQVIATSLGRARRISVEELSSQAM